MLLPSIRLFISCCLIGFFTTIGKAQIKLSYNIGSIGTTGSVNPVFSGPIVFDTSSCIVLSNGIRKWQLPGNGIFTSKCSLLLDNNIEIKLLAFPNPVINSLFLKTYDNIQFSVNRIVTLELLDRLGMRIENYNTDMLTLNQGYEVKMNTLKTGIYFIRIFYGNAKSQLIKIIKAG